MVKRLRANEAGFGLVELIIAMSVLNIGLLALVAALNSGALALARASKLSTAAALADQQMELYRSLTFAGIALDDSTVTTLTSTANEYSCDDAIKVDPSQGCADTNRKAQVTATCTTPLPRECIPSQDVTGPDGGKYRIDAYIVQEVPGGPSAAREVKVVSIVVRNGFDLSRTYVRQQSIFDQSTAG